jgi:hypothetical protein
MAVQLSVTVRANLVKKKFEDLAKEIPDVGAGRLRGRLVSARVKLMRYPPLFQGRYPWVSERQRRYVLWAIRNGIIEVPYKRTRRYAQGWKIAKVQGGYRLSNSVPYSKWVGGGARGEPQARIHQGRWLTFRGAVEDAVKGLPEEISMRVKMVSRRQGF